MSFDEVDNVQSPGVRLNHVRSGSGEPLVLMHGIGDSHEAWTPVRELLAAHHECIAVDLPGFGRSRALPATPTPRALAHAVVDFMGGGRFHVAGNSLGGGVALEIAKAGHALSVTGFAPIGFQRGWERAWLRVAIEAMHSFGPAMFRVTGPKLSSWLVMDRPRPRDVLERGMRELRLAPGWESTAPLTVAYDFEGRIDVPVTIAWGEHDKVLLPRQAKRARAALPQANHLTLRGCGHLPSWDSPEQVADAIRSATRSPQPPARAGA
jgi:pimeloyl-ACP methyl ester carboxylesterase